MKSIRAIILTTTIAIASATVVYAGPGQGGVVINAQIYTEIAAP